MGIQNQKAVAAVPAICVLAITAEQLQTVQDRPASDADEVLGPTETGVDVLPATRGFELCSLGREQVLKSESRRTCEERRFEAKGRDTHK